MNKIQKEIIAIEKKVNTLEIDMSSLPPHGVAIKIMLYDYDYFKNILKRLNSRTFLNRTEDKIESYSLIFRATKTIIQKIFNNIKQNKLTMLFSCGTGEIIPYLKSSPYYKTDLSDIENIKTIFLHTIHKNIVEVNNIIELLDSKPEVFTNSQIDQIDNNFSSRFENDVIIYKDINLRTCAPHIWGIYSNSNSANLTKNTLLDIIAFFNCSPLFIHTKNPLYNEKLETIYEKFDILEMLHLRSHKFFKSGDNGLSSLEPIYFKSKSDYITIATSDHPIIFDLYHASVKQLEPLPRCIFLYRILEYAFQKHYQPVVNPTNFKPINAIEFYFEKAMHHNFIPVYFIDHGMSSNWQKGTFKKTRKVSMLNLMTVLKKECRDILHEWKNHQFLSDKSIGQILYDFGRNQVAHGGNGTRNSTYDYSVKYNHINNVNVFLELISRYLIELLNPKLAGLIEKRKKFYISSSINKKLFEE